MVNFRWTGYNTLILLAAMQADPQRLYEAAMVDGAGRWQTFRSITIPALKPTIIFVVITSTIGGLQIFDEPRMFDQAGQGGADRQWMTVTMYLYELGWGAQKSFGRASAVAWILFLIILVIGAINFKVTQTNLGYRLERRQVMSSTGMVEQTAGKGAARYARRRANRKAGGVGSNRRGGWVTYTLLTIVLLISFYPLYYSFLLASSDAQTIAQNPIPSLIPDGNFIDNVSRVLNSDIKFWQALWNSVIVAVITSIAWSCSPPWPGSRSPSCASAAGAPCWCSSSPRWPCRPSSASCRCSS